MSNPLKRTTAALMRLAHSRLRQPSSSQRTECVRLAHRTLLAEGKALRLPQPGEKEIESWFLEFQIEYSVALSTAGKGSTIKALGETYEQWKWGQLEIPGSLFHSWRFMAALAAFQHDRRRHPSPAVIAFDCDGVLYDFNETLRDWLVTQGWERAKLPNPTVYSLADAWGLHDDHLQREISNAVRARKLWNVGRPLYDGISAAQFLATQGHSVIVNTARRIPGLEEESRAATLIWLREHGVHPDGLHLADPRNPSDKLSIDFDILLDDHASNVEVALRAGRDSLLIDRPWNMNETRVLRATFADAIRIIDRQRMPMPVS